mmetsp:Transcript_7100/g.14858  ORF Transcript_7100/g.14858 Transcript_7100/m.14858 type:complete len:277 (+) Transcript_7100:103-933(+)
MLPNYRRDGATKPLFRSRVSMMSSQPRQTEEEAEQQQQQQKQDFLMRMTTSSFGGTPTTSHRTRPRPRMWSSNPVLVSNKRSYSDAYYDDSDSSDSEDEDEEDEVLSHGVSNKNEIDRPISPTSCASFDRHGRYRKKRRTSRQHRRRSSSSSDVTTERHVMFATNPVAEVRYRPRTPVDEKAKLFYSKRQIKDFRSDYYDWLDQGYRASDWYDMTDDEEDDDEPEEQQQLATAATTTTIAKMEQQLQETPKSGVVTPDVSSEEEDGSEDSDSDHDD